MPRRTLQDALDSRIPEAVNLPSTDSRVVQYINEAQLKLWQRGHWWGSMARFNMAVSNGLITFPRQVATIERAAVGQRLVPVHDFWFEWLDNGWGPINETCLDGRMSCEFRGNYPLATDVFGTVDQFGNTDVVLQCVCDLAVDSGKQVLIQGYDFHTPPNWVRTQIGSSGDFQSGELLTMDTAVQPIITTNTSWTKVTDLTFPDNMQGQCHIYQFDFNTNVTTLLGSYDANNPRPSFARYLFPSLVPFSSNQTCQIEVLAKLDFIPVSIPSDYLMIGNLPALKLACMAIKAEEELRFSDASMLMNGGLNTKTGVTIRGAIQELDSELDHFLGSGRRIGMNVSGFHKDMALDHNEWVL